MAAEPTRTSNLFHSLSLSCPCTDSVSVNTVILLSLLCSRSLARASVTFRSISSLPLRLPNLVQNLDLLSFPFYLFLLAIRSHSLVCTSDFCFSFSDLHSHTTNRFPLTHTLALSAWLDTHVYPIFLTGLFGSVTKHTQLRDTDSSVLGCFDEYMQIHVTLINR